MHNPSDAISIVLALTLVVSVGVWQEWKSDKALEYVKDLMVKETRVVRSPLNNQTHDTDVVKQRADTTNEGDNPNSGDDLNSGSRDKTRSCFLASTIVPVSEIVVGDVVCLGIGAVVPADVLILATYGNFQVNESKLTGESKPVGVEVGGEIQSGGNVVGGKAVGKVVR